MKTTFYEDRKEKHIAKELQNQLETGSVNKAESARRHGMSRARITLIMNLLKLEPTIKEETLNMSEPNHVISRNESFEKIAGLSSPKKQLHAFEHLKSGVKNEGGKYSGVPSK